MTNTVRRLFITLPLLFVGIAPALAGPREEARLLEATQVLEDTAQMPDLQIPDWLLKRAQGIAVLPTVVKVGLINLGGSGGKGVLTVRDAEGRWTSPAFIRLAAGSIGFQIGVQATDIVLVFTTRKSVEGITGGKVTLGADASVATGPVGRQVSGATDISFQAEVYSYSRSKGLYAGVALDGTVMTIDNRANAAYYQKPGVLASDIFSGRAPAPPAGAQRYLDALRQLLHGDAPAAAPKQTAAAAEAPPHAEATAAAPDGRALESGGATAYPLPQSSQPH
jgi:lipid-binding SYLF domain-containing protein